MIGRQSCCSQERFLLGKPRTPNDVAASASLPTGSLLPRKAVKLSRTLHQSGVTRLHKCQHFTRMHARPNPFISTVLTPYKKLASADPPGLSRTKHNNACSSLSNIASSLDSEVLPAAMYLYTNKHYIRTLLREHIRRPRHASTRSTMCLTSPHPHVIYCIRGLAVWPLPHASLPSVLPCGAAL
jgi:hypothetical protein